MKGCIFVTCLILLWVLRLTWKDLSGSLKCARGAGGLPQPGPIFQALPEPAPLPPLPQPEMPANAEAMSPGMAPETAPASLPQPGTSFQVPSSTLTVLSIQLRIKHLRHKDVILM